LRSFSGAKTSVSGSKFTTQLYRAWSGIEPHSKVRAVLVEGESDAWVMYARFGLEFAVYALPSGASTWRDEWGEELVKNHQQIVVVFDNDDAGQKARERVKVALKKHQHLV